MRKFYAVWCWSENRRRDKESESVSILKRSMHREGRPSFKTWCNVEMPSFFKVPLACNTNDWCIKISDSSMKYARQHTRPSRTPPRETRDARDACEILIPCHDYEITPDNSANECKTLRDSRSRKKKINSAPFCVSAREVPRIRQNGSWKMNKYTSWHLLVWFITAFQIRMHSQLSHTARCVLVRDSPANLARYARAYPPVTRLWSLNNYTVLRALLGR